MVPVMRPNAFVLSLAFLVCAIEASASTIVGWHLPRGWYEPPSLVAEGVEFKRLTAGAGMYMPQLYRYSRWNARNMAEAIELEEWLTFGFTSEAGVDLNRLSFSLGAQANAPDRFVMQYSLDGGDWVNIAHDRRITSSAPVNYVFGFGPELDETRDITFRMLAWGATTEIASMSMALARFGENQEFGIELSTIPTPVPLPGTLPALLGGLGLAGVVRLLRRR